MKRCVFGLVLAIVLCSGQQCGPPLPGDDGVGDSAAPLDPDAASPAPPPPPVVDEAPAPPDEPPPPVDAPSEGNWQALWGTSRGLGVASTFAIDTCLLATNGHVAEAIVEALRQPDGWAVFVQHETAQEAEVVNVWVHPDWNGNPGTTPDVAIIEVDTPLTSVLPVSPIEDLYALQVFDDVVLCGFPGDVTVAVDFVNREPGDVFRPRATCLQGSITALRPFDASDLLTPENAQLVQNDIPGTQGTSGSAIVDSRGQVVAVNSWRTLDEAGLNRFAPRADMLLDLWAQVDDGSLASLSLEPVAGSTGLAYQNTEFGFGFDPPPGFVGPLAVDADVYALFSVRFEALPGLGVTVLVSPNFYASLEAFVFDWISLRTAAGKVLASDQRLTMTSGLPLAILEWYNPILDVVSVEAWALSGDLDYSYSFRVFFFLASDLVLYEASVLQSFQTICVD